MAGKESALMGGIRPHSRLLDDLERLLGHLHLHHGLYDQIRLQEGSNWHVIPHYLLLVYEFGCCATVNV